MQFTKRYRPESVFVKRLFGCCSDEWDAELMELDVPIGIAYMKFAQESLFDWHPNDPGTALSSQLYSEVQRLLAELDKSRLGLFVSVGTFLDFHHGIHGFFHIEGTGRICTLNAEGALDASRSSVADVVLDEKDFFSTVLLSVKAEEICRNLANDRDMMCCHVDQHALRRWLLAKAIERNERSEVKRGYGTNIPNQMEQLMRRREHRTQRRHRDPKVVARVENLKKVLGI